MRRRHIPYQPRSKDQDQRPFSKNPLRSTENNEHPILINFTVSKFLVLDNSVLIHVVQLTGCIQLAYLLVESIIRRIKIIVKFKKNERKQKIINNERIATM